VEGREGGSEERGHCRCCLLVWLFRGMSVSGLGKALPPKVDGKVEIPVFSGPVAFESLGCIMMNGLGKLFCV
jgi:hypothetical protein